MNSIVLRARELEQQLVNWRREIHEWPELGFGEERTARLIEKALVPLGYRIRTRVGTTGILAERGNGSPVMAIRADMDALPIEELNTVPYVSRNPGIMHACGHDAHVAMALGAAVLFSEIEFPGTIRFLFQPSEERADSEGLSGAQRMIEDEAMKDVDAIVALHVDTDLDVGDITLGVGPVSAGADEFNISIFGRGGHGAYPQNTIDPLLIASQLVLSINTIVSRKVAPGSPAVISVCNVHGGTANNVIPEEVRVGGTLRYYDSSVRTLLRDEIRKCLDSIIPLGARYTLEYEDGYPPMSNDKSMVDIIQRAVEEISGAGHVLPKETTMGAEDFGYFSQIVPGAMFGLGCRIKGDNRIPHNPRFDIDEQCLSYGSAILTLSALTFLRQDNR